MKLTYDQIEWLYATMESETFVDLGTKDGDPDDIGIKTGKIFDSDDREIKTFVLTEDGIEK